METMVQESSWSECLCEAHCQFMLNYIAQAEACESMVIDDYLSKKERE